MASPGSGARGAQNCMELFVAHKMTRNNTPNKIHVAATELPQLLSQNTNVFGETTAQRLSAAVKFSENFLEVGGVPSAPQLAAPMKEGRRSHALVTY